LRREKNVTKCIRLNRGRNEKLPAQKAGGLYKINRIDALRLL
jgi:hypothetical protein